MAYEWLLQACLMEQFCIELFPGQLATSWHSQFSTPKLKSAHCLQFDLSFSLPSSPPLYICPLSHPSSIHLSSPSSLMCAFGTRSTSTRCMSSVLATSTGRLRAWHSQKWWALFVERLSGGCQTKMRRKGVTSWRRWCSIWHDFNEEMDCQLVPCPDRARSNWCSLNLSVNELTS